ncbi:haloacid dehalogenase-like hydrolase [Defluviitalea saccharophila]|uniref:Haloacid dehalogenase-like hydrolase n=1 Tax=Defluviitalea saccharophila TaxID=879970 RepID=A0ABZ2Y9W7_9FIRM
MMKRILDLNASDLASMDKKEKLLSIKAAEGRTLVSEVIGVFPPILYDVSNVEVACAFGADIILLNFYDVDNPKVLGLPTEEGESVIKEIKRLTGRMVGINLEPVDENAVVIDERASLPKGRTASVENVQKAIAHGADMVVLTGNPKTGVTNEEILKKINEISSAVGNEIIIAAGKMHAAGSSDESGKGLIDKETVLQFIKAGTDILLLPAPGTVPGMTVEYIKDLVDFAHENGCMTMTTIGTSQEGADQDTIKSIALYSKMTGTDMHHIGDSGMSPGIATPENIMTYSIAIKGKRHTYRRMARSVNR